MRPDLARTATWIWALGAAIFLATPGLWAQETSSPALPEGPEMEDAPPLPQGPDSGGIDAPPAPLEPGGQGPPPLGPGDQGPEPLDPKPGDGAEPADAPATDWFDFGGFVDLRGGVRTQSDPHQEDDATLGEARAQIQWEKNFDDLTLNVTADFLYDAVADGHAVDLETGRGWLDLRKAYVGFTPLEFLDVRLGRQILTWGTGDLVFLNDLFPKDWQSFFAGRDVEYLKAPSDALRLGFFSDLVNADFVYVPAFDADRYITGRRNSYYSPRLGRRAGQDAIVDADRPDEWFHTDEMHLRLYRRIESVELAAYGYHGYWKSPGGLDPLTGRATFPKLDAYGASARGPLAEGIANFEASYYHSRDDAGGKDPFTNNSELRLLAGFERDLPELTDDLTIGLQYYIEWMMDYGDYRRALPAGMEPADEVRHLTTFRVTKKLMNQDLTLSLFAFYSPSDSDAYLRPKISYRIDDHWSVELGGNVFIGREESTFFGQFERNSNIYAALRYGF
jgi:hypothetical protein